MNVQKPAIIWFRQDLRVEDHPALVEAIQTKKPIIPVFILTKEDSQWSLGGASKWWLHYSLKNLQSELQDLGLSLILCQKDPLHALLQIAKESDADSIYWNRCYEPAALERDAAIKAELHLHGIKSFTFNGRLLFEPWEIANKQNKPFQVFTPFWKHCLSLPEPGRPLPKPSSATGYKNLIETESLASLNLLPKVRWDEGLEKMWQPGSQGGKGLLERGIKEVVKDYSETRDRPDLDGTTRLSPYLQFGEISPRMIWHAVRDAYGSNQESAEAYLRQLGWREFAYHLLYHFPDTPTQPLKKTFASFAWKRADNTLKAWQHGFTGYPIVDAGMRQLWQTGWMHNRVRMIAASFLVKDLLINWTEGAKWFWDTLVDADLANNTLGWQWVAGCGADAAPYFRIFNPVTQGERFDPFGEYVRKWLPELKLLPTKWIQKPWLAPKEILQQAGVELGKNYPYPIVDHAEAREEALKVYKGLNESQ